MIRLYFCFRVKIKIDKNHLISNNYHVVYLVKGL